MKPHNLPLDKPTLLSFAVIGLTLLTYGVFKDALQSDANQSYLNLIYGTSFLFTLLPWSVVLVDVIRSRVHNKLMWFVALFTVAPLAAILYLANREKHLRLYDKFDNI